MSWIIHVLGWFAIGFTCRELLVSKVRSVRYFIVFYSGKINEENNLILCSCSYTTEDGNFINRDFFINKQLEMNPQFTGGVIITNITEVNKKDFETWELCTKK